MIDRPGALLLPGELPVVGGGGGGGNSELAALYHLFRCDPEQVETHSLLPSPGGQQPVKASRSPPGQQQALQPGKRPKYKQTHVKRKERQAALEATIRAMTSEVASLQLQQEVLLNKSRMLQLFADVRGDQLQVLGGQAPPGDARAILLRRFGLPADHTFVLKVPQSPEAYRTMAAPELAALYKTQFVAPLSALLEQLAGGGSQADRQAADRAIESMVREAVFLQHAVDNVNPEALQRMQRLDAEGAPIDPEALARCQSKALAAMQLSDVQRVALVAAYGSSMAEVAALQAQVDMLQSQRLLQAACLSSCDGNLASFQLRESAMLRQQTIVAALERLERALEVARRPLELYAIGQVMTPVQVAQACVYTFPGFPCMWAMIELLAQGDVPRTSGAPAGAPLPPSSPLVSTSPSSSGSPSG